MFGGMGGMNNMNGMMKKVQKLQKQMQDMQEQLKKETVEASAGGGVVKITINGEKQVQYPDFSRGCRPRGCRDAAGFAGCCF